MPTFNHSYWFLGTKSKTKQNIWPTHAVVLNSFWKIQAVEIILFLLLPSFVNVRSIWSSCLQSCVSNDVNRWNRYISSPTLYCLSFFHIITSFIYFKLNSEVLCETTVIRDTHRYTKYIKLESLQRVEVINFFEIFNNFRIFLNVCHLRVYSWVFSSDSKPTKFTLHERLIVESELIIMTNLMFSQHI